MQKVSRKKWAVFGIVMLILVAILIYLSIQNREPGTSDNKPAAATSGIASIAETTGIKTISAQDVAKTKDSWEEKYKDLMLYGELKASYQKYNEALPYFEQALSILPKEQTSKIEDTKYRLYLLALSMNDQQKVQAYRQLVGDDVIARKEAEREQKDATR